MSLVASSEIAFNAEQVGYCCRWLSYHTDFLVYQEEGTTYIGDTVKLDVEEMRSFIETLSYYLGKLEESLEKSNTESQSDTCGEEEGASS